MSTATFTTVLAAVEYLESPTYSRGSDVAQFQGRRVLLVLRLNQSARDEYLRIKSATSKRIWKEVVVHGAKKMGLDAAKIIAKSKSGDIIGTLGSMFSLLRGASTSDSDGIDERISSSSADGALYLRFENAFRRRCYDPYPGVYRYAIDKLGFADARAAERREGELDGSYTFMYTL